MSEADYLYPCDGLPDTASPALTLLQHPHMTISASGGMLHMYQQPNAKGEMDYVILTWTLPESLSSIEFEVSIPTMTDAGKKYQLFNPSVVIRHTSAPTSAISFVAKKYYSYGSLTFSGFEVTNGVLFDWTGSFLDTWTGKILPGSSADHVNVYLNDALIGSDVAMSGIQEISFDFHPSGYGDITADLDYFNVLVDKVLGEPRGPFSFPWPGRINLFHVI